MSHEHAKVAVCYLRVSTTEQAENGHSLDAQRTAVTNLCLARGWAIEGIYDDAGLSGTSRDRPGLESCLKALRGKKANVLVALRFDRLFRSTGHAADVINEAKDKGWHICTQDMDFDLHTPAGKLIYMVFAMIGEFENDLRKQRIKEGFAAGKAKGRVYGRFTKLITPEMEELIMKMYRLKLKPVDGVRSKYTLIAAHLNRRGILTPTGKPWSRFGVKKIVTRINLEQKKAGNPV